MALAGMWARKGRAEVSDLWLVFCTGAVPRVLQVSNAVGATSLLKVAKLLRSARSVSFWLLSGSLPVGRVETPTNMGEQSPRLATGFLETGNGLNVLIRVRNSHCCEWCCAKSVSNFVPLP
jgi:hypothetical protein